VNRDSIIKGLAVLSAAALVAFVGFSIVKTFLNLSKKAVVTEEAAPATLDENAALKATIDSLEMSWQNIQSHQFRLAQDPLHLGRVIKNFQYVTKGSKESEEDDAIRLTATVIDDNPKAIIKFNGKSYVVQKGEMIETAYRVTSIEKKQVVLDGAGGRVVLVNKPLQELESGGESDYSNGGEVESQNY